ncbi:MAG TPA: FAD-dependent thymidylate synthase [Sporichthyaceae bacterium]|nr:FAD-dependent thymidylate synthase [Sporichthyaceae bacterium]
MDEASVEFRSAMTVELVKATASDGDVLFAARVSTKGEQSREDVDADASRSVGLIRYLMRDRHGSPFEHNSMTFFVEAPIFVFREFMRHRMACVTGDAQVVLCDQYGKGLRTRTVRQIWENWHLGLLDHMPGGNGYKTRRRLLPSSRQIYARVYNEDTLLPQPGRVLDVIQAGVKPVVELTTRAGRTLRCTEDHRVLTVDGWKRVHEVTGTDFLLRAGKRAIRDEAPIPPMLRRGIGVWTSGLRDVLIEPMEECYLCHGKFPREEMVLDHEIPVAQDLTKALDVSNLKPACLSCHRLKTNGEQIYAQRLGSRSAAVPDRLASIVPCGEEMTYDLVIDEPWHNYLANGLVVHNSYNEESGRYRELRPLFYVPGPDRKLRQEGKPGAYHFADGTQEQYELVDRLTRESCAAAYAAYQEMLAAGVAREVARIVLPVTTYSSMYVTMNARSLMNFLSLRTKREDSAFPSFPQREIEMVAEEMERYWAELMPLTHQAFDGNGRVAP